MLDPGPHTTLANWRDAPFNRWSFLHVDRVVPTAAISRGGAPVAPFAVRDGDVLDVPVTRASGYPGRVADVLRDTDTDAFLVLNDGVTEVVKLDEASGSDCQAAGSSFRGSLIQADAGRSRIFGSWVVANLVGCCCRAASRVWERCRAVSPARP